MVFKRTARDEVWLLSVSEAVRRLQWSSNGCRDERQPFSIAEEPAL